MARILFLRDYACAFYRLPLSNRPLQPRPRRRAASCRVQSASADASVARRRYARRRHGEPGLVIERFQTSLKGIEGHFDVWRVRRPNAKS
jgi:hypothetical protein